MAKNLPGTKTVDLEPLFKSYTKQWQRIVNRWNTKEVLSSPSYKAGPPSPIIQNYSVSGTITNNN